MKVEALGKPGFSFILCASSLAHQIWAVLFVKRGYKRIGPYILLNNKIFDLENKDSPGKQMWM